MLTQFHGDNLVQLITEFQVVAGQALNPVASPHHRGMLLLLQNQLLQSFKQSCNVTICVFINFLLQSIGPRGAPLPSFPLRMSSSHTPAGSVLYKIIVLLYEVVSFCRFARMAFR